MFRSFRLFILIIILLSLLLGITVANALDQQLQERLDHSTYKVGNAKHRLLGTAFAISDNGYIATNYHVTEASGDHWEVQDWEGKWWKAELVAVSPPSDLAILRIVDAEDTAHLPVLKNRALTLGEKVSTCGFPEDEGKTLRRGKVLSFDGNFDKLTPGLKYIVNRLELTPGMSGSALVNEDGELVGIHNARQGSKTSLAVPVVRLEGLLQRLGLCYLGGTLSKCKPRQVGVG